MKTILLLGPPNSGKTALFNLMSGSNRKVANYSGITVDSAKAELKSNRAHETQIEIIDLPGIYSLTPSSIDEAVTLSTLLKLNPKQPDYQGIIVVVDMSRIESSLALALSLKTVFADDITIVFNKSDLELAKNYDIDGLGKNLGVPYLIASTFNSSSDEIDQFIRQNLPSRPISLQKKINLPPESLAFNPFKIDWQATEEVELHHNEVDSLALIESFQRKARDLKASYAIGDKMQHIRISNQIDKVILHPLAGGLVFLGIFYFIFHALYSLSAPLMELIDQSIGQFGHLIQNALPPGHVSSFLVDGVIAGVGGVIIFLPQIVILFFLLSLLEQSGYIARASIITDKIMAIFGLNGKAFLPYMSGFACSVPAIMATRTISDKRERMATLMTIPLITCSARLPVYILLIGTFIPKQSIFGIFDSQALAFFFLYFLGSITALIMAKIFRLTLYQGRTSSFFIELPLYQRPSLKIAFRAMRIKGKVFLKKAGTTILGLSILIWILSTFPQTPEERMANLDEGQQATLTLENSAIGHMGKAIAPLIEPLGYNWKIGVGILVAFGARELFVSTLGTIYSLGDVDEESSTLRERMKNEINPATGLPVYNLAVAWSLLIFFAFAMQCISTLAIVKKETEEWKYVAGMLAYMTLLAYGGAYATYHLLI